MPDVLPFLVMKAAKLYGVPPSTLKDRLSGRVVHDVNPGPKQYLTKQEEKELTDQLVLSVKAKLINIILYLTIMN